MKTINKKYTGVIVPMVTPFTEALAIDLNAVEKILDTFLKANVSPFVNGTTGESASISEAQKAVLVKATVEKVQHKTLVYAGISGNCLQESIDNAKKYADMGADVVVAHIPFYFPMSPDQMLRYFAQLADKVPCPLILYNMPITTKQSIPLNVIDQLSRHPNIAGTKDSEKGIERLDESLKLWSDRTDFVHLTGCALQSAYALQHGSDGLVPSTGNLTPKLYRDLYESAIAGDFKKAFELQDKTNLISEIYQKDRNLSQSLHALKVMMSAYGLCRPFVMPPMYDLDIPSQELIKEKTIQMLGNSIER